MEHNEPLDRDTLAKLRSIGRMTGKDLVGELVEIFLDKEPAVLDAVVAAAERGDAKVLRDTVHHMRSSAGSVGALRLFALCEEVEDLAESGVLDNVPGALDRLREEFDLVCQALHDEKERPVEG